MDKIIYMNDVINSYVWGKYMIIILLFTGLWLMIRTGWLPFRHPLLILKKTLGSLIGKKKGKGVTPFQAVSTALAGTLGVGSIVGVATAITMGGAGALFWMCVSAIFGMMIKYGEVVLAICYRRKEKDGTYIGGPMTTLENGCHLPYLGIVFALLCILASFGIGNVTPANTIMESIQVYLPISPTLVGIILACGIACVIFGKGNTIMRFNEITIPFISILYIVACCYLIWLHHDQLYNVVCQVIQEACTIHATASGVGGYAISRAIHFGIARGVFSNEAGMGSSPISHASVSDAHPIEQGFWGIFEVFFDTIVVCLLTGLMILTSGLHESGLDGVALTIRCFEEGFGSIGGMIFTISIISFAIPSILGWYYYARECIRYLFHSRWVLLLYQAIFLCLLIVGPQLELSFVWNVADTLNGCMAIPNLISILILSKVVVKLTKEYMNEHRSG